MRRETFERQNERDWRRLDSFLNLSGKPKKRAGAARFPVLYRQACQHLALARHRHYGADLEQRLNRLVLRGHQRLYRNRSIDLSALARFAVSGFPALVRAEGRLVGLAVALFLGPLLALFIAVNVFPDVALTVIDPVTLESYGEMYGPGGSLEAGRPVDSDVLMFGFYIYNNISIAFRTFASGILFGVGSIFFLVYNGVAIGTVAGYMQHSGFYTAFYPFVIGHGAFELTAIVLSGAAGLHLGLTLVSPGRKTRSQALRDASHRIVPMVYGVAVMLVVAAFFEAFWSSSTLVPAAVKYVVGAALWFMVLIYFSLFGRGDGS